MHHRLQIKVIGYKWCSSPFRATGETTSGTSRVVELTVLGFLQICVQCPHKTPLQKCNNPYSPSGIPSALPPPWLLVSSLQICLKSLFVLMLGWLGHTADVLGVVTAWQVCMALAGTMWSASTLPCSLISCFIAEIAMLLRSLHFCLLCLTFPTKGLPDRQTNEQCGCIHSVSLGNQARDRNILVALGKICGFQAFTSLKTDTHWSCWSCICSQ